MIKLQVQFGTDYSYDLSKTIIAIIIVKLL
jgi:hypothetical protein